MDIEGQLRKARQAGVAADKGAIAEAEKLKSETKDSIRLLQQTFGEFIETLIRHNVPQWKLVLLASSWVPEQRGLFKSTPGHSVMTALPLGSCWPFGTTLLFEEGSILNATGVKVGKGIVPSDPYDRKVSAGFLKLSREALSAAGLGTDLSDDCLYIVKDARTPNQLSGMDWSAVRTSSSHEGMSLWVHQDEYLVASGKVFVRRDDPHSDWRRIDVPMDMAIAQYITNAERHGAHGLTWS